MPNKNGMNWCRQSTRLAIYLRDGLACAYCGTSIEDGAQLTLDHVRCRKSGGGNEPTNLVTCCHRCNSSRADRPLRVFAAAVSKYINHGVTPRQIADHVCECTARPLPRREANDLIARRGSAAKALARLRRK